MGRSRASPIAVMRRLALPGRSIQTRTASPSGSRWPASASVASLSFRYTFPRSSAMTARAREPRRSGAARYLSSLRSTASGPMDQVVCGMLSMPLSVEIVRIEVDVDAAHASHFLRADRCHAILALQDAVDNQKRLFDDHEPVACEKVRTNNDARNAC